MTIPLNGMHTCTLWYTWPQGWLIVGLSRSPVPIGQTKV